jgi:hypothetical protein
MLIMEKQLKIWERDCKAHIAREVDSKYYNQVFTDESEDFDLLLLSGPEEIGMD